MATDIIIYTAPVSDSTSRCITVKGSDAQEPCIKITSNAQSCIELTSQWFDPCADFPIPDTPIVSTEDLPVAGSEITLTIDNYDTDNTHYYTHTTGGVHSLDVNTGIITWTLPSDYYTNVVFLSLRVVKTECNTSSEWASYRVEMSPNIVSIAIMKYGAVADELWWTEDPPTFVTINEMRMKLYAEFVLEDDSVIEYTEYWNMTDIGYPTNLTGDIPLGGNISDVGGGLAVSTQSTVYAYSQIILGDSTSIPYVDITSDEGFQERETNETTGVLWNGIGEQKLRDYINAQNWIFPEVY